MKVNIVTGGAGFIGTNLCKALLRNGERVVAIDDLSCTKNKPLDHENYVFIESDIVTCWGSIYEELDNMLWPDDDVTIYHLACPASPVQYQRDHLRTINTSYIGSQSVFDYALEIKAKVIFTSTSEVYGDPLVHPQPESYLGNVNTWGPRACYDEGKRAAETLAWIYKQQGLDIVVPRLFNTYGPHMAADDGRVVSNFICQALEGSDITIYGDGQQTRSFCYVDDTVRALRMLASLKKGTIDSPINVGNPREFSMRQLADLVLQFTKSNSSLVTKPLPVDDPKVRKPVVDRITKLGWEAEIQLAEGLIKTIDYFQSINDKDNELELRDDCREFQ